MTDRQTSDPQKEPRVLLDTEQSISHLSDADKQGDVKRQSSPKAKETRQQQQNEAMRVIKALQHTPEFNVKSDAQAKLTADQNLIDAAFSKESEIEEGRGPANDKHSPPIINNGGEGSSLFNIIPSQPKKSLFDNPDINNMDGSNSDQSEGDNDIFADCEDSDENDIQMKVG